jgi:glycosyltransferase involved in cell wall biosynthesis
VRILFVNDGIADAGGVHTYLETVMAGLRARGHELALLHHDRARAGALGQDLPRFGIEESGESAAVNAALAWHADVAYSHNMHSVTVDGRLLDAMPVVKMMHGYAGTCISGQKAHLLPGASACGRRHGLACLALYFPRRCGRMSWRDMRDGHLRARSQQHQFRRFAAVVVASDHMRDEYVRHGVPPEAAHTLPLFPSTPLAATPPAPATPFHVVFLGRMTALKGGDLMLRAAARSRAEIGTFAVTMAGDGPQRAEWMALAARLGIQAAWPGWLSPASRDGLLATAWLNVIPSVWPEPFGMTGLEAAALGVPSAAFAVGGISQWLRDGVNGYAVSAGSEAALSRALVRAFRDPEERRRLGAGAFDTAREFSLGRHLDGLERIFSSAAARGATR